MIREDDTSPRNKSGALAIALTILAIALTLAIAPYSIVDDSYISFRYVHNLIAHGQLVFNLGERVEGATNLAWVVLLAALGVITKAEIPSIALATSIALNVFTYVRVWQTGRKLGAGVALCAVTVLMLGLNMHFVLATTNGLEAGLFAALLAQILWNVLGGQYLAASLFCGILFAVRPDGLIATPAMFVAAWIAGRRLRELILPALIVCGVVSATTAFRYGYFGEWVPNSIIAKSYGLGALPQIALGAAAYGAKFLVANGYLLILPLLAGVALVRRRLSAAAVPPAALFSALTLILSGIVMVRNGGDWMPHWRLLLQYGPLWAVLSLCLAIQLRWSSISYAWLLCWPVVVSLVVVAMHRDGVGRIEQPGEIGPFWADSAARLQSKLEPADVVSAEALGYVAFKLIDVRFHDPVGLVDRHIARYGTPSPRFGKHDTLYTLGAVWPTVALWHYAPHLADVPRQLLDCYEIRAYPGQADAVMMIRRDAVYRLDVAPTWPTVPSSAFSTDATRRADFRCGSEASTVPK